MNLNQNAINCILFIVMTYLLRFIIDESGSEFLALYQTDSVRSCIAIWIAFFIKIARRMVPFLIAVLLIVYNRQKIRVIFKHGKLKSYFLGFSIILLILLVHCGVVKVFGGETKFYLDKPFLTVHNITALVILFIINVMSISGWFGYLLNNLRSQHRIYTRAIGIGMFWSMWQLFNEYPRFISVGGIWVLGCYHIISFCLLSVIMTWLFEKDSSIWPVSVIYTILELMSSSPIIDIFHPKFLFFDLPYKFHFNILSKLLITDKIVLIITYLIVIIVIYLFEKRNRRRKYSD